MLFRIKIVSKDNKILNRFSKFLMKLDYLPVTLKHFSHQRKKKFITILKSPHVNKTAQEQFEFRFYSKEFLVNSVKPLTAFIILKKIKNKSFPGIRFRVKGLCGNSNNVSFVKALDPDTVILCKRDLFASQKKYIQLFDCYGEACLKNSFYSK